MKGCAEHTCPQNLRRLAHTQDILVAISRHESMNVKDLYYDTHDTHLSIIMIYLMIHFEYHDTHDTR